jgi:dihydroorotate dehydrogenase (fumarate)
MKLTTRYLGFDLPHPFVPGASPLADDLDAVRRLEDAGAPMITLRSLFEEQIVAEQISTYHAVQEPAESFAEATSYLVEPPTFAMGPHEYLEHVRRVKQAVGVPVVASLNGTTPGGWLDYAKLIEEAGADALELNVYDLGTDPTQSSDAMEVQTLAVLRQVLAAARVPVAVKLSPFYTSLAHFARRLDEAGAGALVIFNRFYQPDIDPEELEVQTLLELSTSSELRLRLRWLAILSGGVKADLAITGGVHTAVDAVKAIMCGAVAVQVVSALLKHGPQYLALLRERFLQWMQEHEYESLDQMRGSMSLERCPDPKAYERANYMHMLQSWRT